MSEPYSDLEVARESALEYYKPSSNECDGNETRNGKYKEAYISIAPPAAAISVYSEPDLKARSTPRRRICGLRSRTFWIILVVFIVIIAGVVGGGIGGALSNRSSKSSTHSSSAGADPEESSISNSVSTASSTQSSTQSALVDAATKSASSSNTLFTASNTKTSSFSASNTVAAGPITSSASKTSDIAISTTTVIGASTTLLSDCPSSNNTLLKINGSSFRKICSNNYVGNNNLVNQHVNSLDSCISLCDAFNTLNGAEIADGSSDGCNAVCWRGTIAGDDLPGDCFGITTTNSSSGFVYGGDTNCNSAALINQSF